MTTVRKRLTARERQSRRAAREKAVRKWRLLLWRRARFIGIAAAAAYAVGAGGWFWYSGDLSRSWQHGVDEAYAMTARAGFKVDTTYLEGRSRTPLDDIKRVMGVAKGEPILRLSLEDIKHRIESLDRVKAASVERILPSTLHVRIVERQPVALWQHEGEISLIDEEGTVMKETDITPYRRLLLVTGKGAPSRVHALMTVLAAEPELMAKVKAAVFVGERRWNIHLEQGIEIKLPEQDALKAWKELANLQHEQKLLDRSIQAVDLRAPDRVFIRLSPDAMPPIKTSAKET